MICSDIWHKYHEWYFEIVSASEIWDNFEISWLEFMPNITYKSLFAIICLYYCPQKFCNFHMWVFQIKLKYLCSKPIKLQKFLM